MLFVRSIFPENLYDLFFKIVSRLEAVVNCLLETLDQLVFG